MAMLKFVRHELKEFFRMPAVLLVVVLPVFMSTIIIQVMGVEGAEVFQLCMWLLFTQVMIGIMLTAPTLIEDRENKTMDALLLTPLRFGQIVTAKGLTILLPSLGAQLIVLFINRQVSVRDLYALLYVLAGGVLFVFVGLVIGLKIDSTKSGSAAASAVMIAFFLVVTVYQGMPDWTYPLFALIPSIELVEIFSGIFQDGKILLAETAMLLAWIAIFGAWIRHIGKSY